MLPASYTRAKRGSHIRGAAHDTSWRSGGPRQARCASQPGTRYSWWSARRNRRSGEPGRTYTHHRYAAAPETECEPPSPAGFSGRRGRTRARGKVTTPGDSRLSAAGPSGARFGHRTVSRRHCTGRNGSQFTSRLWPSVTRRGGALGRPPMGLPPYDIEWQTGGGHLPDRGAFQAGLTCNFHSRLGIKPSHEQKQR